MRTREAVVFLAAVAGVTWTVIALLAGVEVESASGAFWVGLGAFGWATYIFRDLKKQRVPFWCSAESAQAGRRRFHKFADIGDPYKEPRIWECSVCGIHREFWKESKGGHGD